MPNGTGLDMLVNTVDFSLALWQFPASQYSSVTRVLPAIAHRWHGSRTW